ncbi:MAG: fatty acid desaturase [Myxococcales bacterium]|nr:fatty acid desaturase [Myxococcales bacterium]
MVERHDWTVTERGGGTHAVDVKVPSSTWRTYLNRSSLPFWGIHVAAIVGVLLLGWSWRGLALALALYVARMFFVTAGHHRYFSHRTFKTSRAGQAVLAFLTQTTMQRGVLWWAAKHRHHHRYSDMPSDIHSPVQRGFWFSHVGWSTSDEAGPADRDLVRDLTRYPELVAIDRAKHLPAILLAVVLFAVGGAHALVWGFFVSTVLLWHGTFTINSLSHVIGRRRYPTKDDSRNHWLLALVTLGEGWHNNHHHYQSSCRQGFFWWEVDLTYYVLRMLAWTHVIWDVRQVPDHVRDGSAAPRRAGAQATIAATPAVVVSS